MPSLLTPEALAVGQALNGGDWRPGPGVSHLPLPPPGDRVLAASGRRMVANLAVPLLDLERLEELLRGASRQGQGVVFSDQAREELGWTEADAFVILRALGYVSPRVQPGETRVWRRRSGPAEPKTTVAKAKPTSPFAALAALQPQPPRRRRRRAKRAAAS